MIVKEKEFKDYNDKVYQNQVNVVGYKLVLRVELKKMVDKEFLKSLVRGLFYELNVPIRYRVDVGEDLWIGKNNLYGEALVVVRLKEKIDNIVEDLVQVVKNIGVENIIEIKGHEWFHVNDFRKLNEVYQRALYGLKIDLKTEREVTYIENKGKWIQKVRNWDGSIEEKDVEGLVRIKLRKMESKFPVYKVLVDAPYGVDVYRILEEQFGFEKGSLEGYPIQGIRFYEEIDSRKNYLNRKKCSVFGDPIEMTVGGLVGDKCIKGLMGVTKEELEVV